MDDDPITQARLEEAATRADVRAAASPRAATLGDVLVARGLLTREKLDEALDVHRRSGERLGRVLLSLGYVSRLDMHRALGEVWGLPFVDLTRTPIDATLCHAFDPVVLADGGWIPVARKGDVVRVATSERPHAGIADVVRDVLGPQVTVTFGATTDWDVDGALRQVFRAPLADRAANHLFDSDPMLSARTVLTRPQKVLGALCALLVIAALVWQPLVVLVGVLVAANVAFALAVGFKALTAAVGWRAVRRADTRRDDRIPDHELPVYTVLVPVFGEANVVGDLVEHLGRLDYPQEKLEILLLLEEDDEETIAAARAARPPSMVKFVIVPRGKPQTKPRACNLGLVFARGEFLVIYDAEDIPEPGQLREAVSAFRNSGPELACVQARLNYYNAHENLLTRMFTLEYSWWFDYMLPGLDRLRLPIPLGGTSNHFRTSVLRELGGWDAWNVTEDADLGLRANAKGYTVGVIASTTFEEACGRYRPWIKQRTRWIKGYMQTALVHSRQPLRSLAAAGPRGALGLGLLVAGTPLTFLASPVMWVITAMSFAPALWGAGPADLLPGPFELVALANLVIGNLFMIALNALAVGRRRILGLLPFALLNPVYWILHSIAAWRALGQLAFNPFVWEKTPHGLTSHTATLGIHAAADPAHEAA